MFIEYNTNHPSNPEADRIHFAVLAIEAGAKKLGISPAEMQKRLESAFNGIYARGYWTLSMYGQNLGPDYSTIKLTNTTLTIYYYEA